MTHTDTLVFLCVGATVALVLCVGATVALAAAVFNLLLWLRSLQAIIAKHHRRIQSLELELQEREIQHEKQEA